MSIAVVVAVAVTACGGQDGATPEIPAGSTTVSSPSPETVPPSTGAPAAPPEDASTADPAAGRVQVGAEVLVAGGFEPLRGKRVGAILNQASVVGGEPLLDVLASADELELVAVFGPEHGVRGDAPAGSAVAGEVDPSTGIVVHSLYGDTRAPTPAMLDGLDVLVFDLQDVGARFYTYISTMGLAMQAAAEAGIPFVVLDRPNPLGGDLLDGHLRSDDQASFIGQYPIPSVHGLTTGELALAIKGESWLPGLASLDLTVVEIAGWQRRARWRDLQLDWHPPSPGLPTAAAAEVYPGTVLFEATSLSVGRGTDEPFAVVGAPWVDAEALAATLGELGLAGVGFEPVSFTPVASESVPAPPHEGEVSYGVRVVATDAAFRPVEIGVHLLAAIRAHAAERGVADPIASPDLLDLLAGTDALRTGLVGGTQPAALVDGWSAELAAFAELRRPYLLYE